MISIKAYFLQKLKFSMLVGLKPVFIYCFFALAIFHSLDSFSQDNSEFDEITIFLDVPNVGGSETDVLIKNEEVYLPLISVFDFLRIRNIPSPQLDSISGFIADPQSTYLIDLKNNLIVYGRQEFKLNPGDLIRTESDLYLKGNNFGRIFGIDCDFNFRTMSVTLNTRFELPVIRELRQEEIRKNLNRVIGNVEADTTIGRTYPMFKFGMADWSVVGTEQIYGPSELRLRLGLGAMLFGGEATVALNYNSRYQFTEREQYYLWRYVNNDNKALRQVMAGKILTNATSSIYDPIVGALVTNTPTTFRRSFGTYTLTDNTEPGWLVELYVNNVLVDYVKADASGFFTFDVPLVYGNTFVRLKFYGPFGEEREREQLITTPYNFIPKKNLEYSVSAGVVEDSIWSRFSRASVNYGLSRGVTIGAGYEYLSSVSSGPFMPFVKGSFRLAPNLLLSGEYTHTVRSKATLTYRLASNIQFDLLYINYADGQQAINNNFREERKIAISLPFHVGKFSAFHRLSLNQLVLQTGNYTTGEWLISATLSRVNANITTYAILINEQQPNIYSNLSLSVRLPLNFTVIPQMQYSYTENRILSSKIGIEKRLFQFGYLTASYEQNFRSNLRMVEFGFRYDFKFAQAGVSGINTNRNSFFIQYARGSIRNDGKTKYMGTDRISQVGRGGINIVPFLDINANGKKDAGEPKAVGLNLRSSGGKIERREQDTIIRILNLEPYTNCYIELDQSGFSEVAWRLENHSMNVAVDPNILKTIEVPIKIVGEASGMVLIDRNKQEVGLGRIIINFYSKEKKVGETLSEEDGYFSYFGLNPGDFYARIDSVQLRKLGMTCLPDTIHFKITENLEGDYIGGVDFKLNRISTKQDIPKTELESKEDTTQLITQETSEEIINIIPTKYIIQLGAFSNKDNAEALKIKIVAQVVNKGVNILEEDELYKLQIVGFTRIDEVNQFFSTLKAIGITDVYVITLNEINDIEIDTPKPLLIPGVNNSVIEKDTVPQNDLQKEEVIPETVKTYEDKDTSKIIVHEITEEVLTSNIDTYAVQLGAFKRKTNAYVLRKKLIKALGKRVDIFVESGFYKVRIAGFESREEIDKYIPVLVQHGVYRIYVNKLKGIQKQQKKVDRIDSIKDIRESINGQDTVYFIVHEIYEEVISSSVDSYAIQIGAFNNKSNAFKFKEKLTNLVGKSVDIFYDEGYYKVRISGFRNRDEVKSYTPTLLSLGVNEIWVTTLKGMQKHMKVSSKLDTIEEIIVPPEKLD